MSDKRKTLIGVVFDTSQGLGCNLNESDCHDILINIQQEVQDRFKEDKKVEHFKQEIISKWLDDGNGISRHEYEELYLELTKLVKLVRSISGIDI